MELIYCGSHHQTLSPAMQALATSETATCLGARLHRKQYTVAARAATQGAELTYPGIHGHH